MKRIAIFGSTGSIGTQTLSIIEEYQNRFNMTLTDFYIIFHDPDHAGSGLGKACQDSLPGFWIN